MRKFLYATVAIGAIVACNASAHATLILTFGQTGSNTAVTATENAGNTATTLSSINAPISITQIENGVPTPAFFTLAATSNGPAVTVLGATAQKFDGVFSIRSGLNNTGTNFLTGVFTDVTIGAGAGGALTVGAPPDSLVLSSSVITDLAQPSALGLGFANVVPGFNLVGSSVGSFTSSVSGTFSASPAPEPTSLARMGVGLLGLGFVANRKRS